MIKYPITAEDYIKVFDKTKQEFCKEFDDLYAMGQDPRVDTFKRLFFKKYVPEVTKENLYRYYMSDAFSYVMQRNMPENFDAIIDKFANNKYSNWIVDLHRVFPLNNAKNINILDYGSGANFASIVAAYLGYNVTLADIPHKHFQLMKFCLKKYFNNIDFIELDVDGKINKIYDLIVSMEVLEHTIEPEEVLQNLISCLKLGGWMYLGVFMDDMNGQDPSHLKRNTERYNNPDIWHKIVESYGVRPLIYDNNGVIKWWYKI